MQAARSETRVRPAPGLTSGQTRPLAEGDATAMQGVSPMVLAPFYGISSYPPPETPEDASPMFTHLDAP